MNRDRARDAAASPPQARDESRAQPTIEFILAVPLFLFLMFAVLDFSRMFFVQLNLQDAIEQAARIASTGNHLADPDHPGQNLSRINSIIATA
jgi:Flp pilus assembly protein TadG